MTPHPPTDPSMPSHYPASQTALLLLDFHKAFVSNSAGPGAPAALSIAASLKKSAKAHGIHVLHCLLDTSSTALPTAKDAARLTSSMAHFRTGPGDEASELLEDSSGEMTFTRRVGIVSALKSPGLMEYLGEKGVRSLVVAGLSTSGCVARTAFAAGDEGFVVTVVGDGCADGDGEVHGVMVGKVLGKRGYVCSGEEVMGGWEKGDLGV